MSGIRHATASYNAAFGPMATVVGPTTDVGMVTTAAQGPAIDERTISLVGGP